MTRTAIPEQTKQWADEVIKDFNERVVRDPDRYFASRYRGRYLYLERLRHRAAHPVCRLTYTGSPDQWDFAIFKHSDDRYDPDEWFFPGADQVDGTLPGALRAALAAYP